MARRKVIYRNRRPKRMYHRPKFTLPMAIVAGVTPTAAAGIRGLVDGTQMGGIQQGIDWMALNLSRALLGYDTHTNQWSWNWMKQGAVPLVLGIVVHKTIGGMLGVNRLLARANVPLIRV